MKKLFVLLIVLLLLCACDSTLPKLNSELSTKDQSINKPESMVNKVFPVACPDKDMEKHSLGGPTKSEITIVNILREANLKIKVEDAPLKDGTSRRMINIENAGAFLDITGDCYVSSSSVTIVPTNDNVVNINSLVVMGAALDTFCTHDSPNGGKLFLQRYSDFIGSNKATYNGTAGKCKYEIFQTDKTVNIQMSLVTFKSKN